MEWRDQGAVLSVRKHGETSAIVEVFTEAHGRHAGVVRGAISRKLTPVLQPGSQVDVTWRARLEDHLGTFVVEPLRSRSAVVMSDRLALSGLNAITAMLRFTLPERAPHAQVYAGSVQLLDMLGVTGDWQLAYLRWELMLLEEMGFALDLSRCAVTGSFDDLIYVSPRTGRAVSRQGAGNWAARLLPLPACLLGQGGAETSELLQGLTTTGHFLNLLAQDLGNRPLPEARNRFIDLLARQCAPKA
jgi:DNA repair protein RecO (recombination protein O)